MSEQEKKESIICLTLKPSLSFFVYRIQTNEKFLQKKHFKVKGEWRIEQKMK